MPWSQFLPGTYYVLGIFCKLYIYVLYSSPSLLEHKNHGVRVFRRFLSLVDPKSLGQHLPIDHCV